MPNRKACIYTNLPAHARPSLGPIMQVCQWYQPAVVTYSISLKTPVITATATTAFNLVSGFQLDKGFGVLSRK